MEESVVHEVKREAGTAVQDIRYFRGQAWPFPHSLMIAFTATSREGEISIDDSRIGETGWFTIDNLLPVQEGSASLANQLTSSL